MRRFFSYKSATTPFYIDLSLWNMPFKTRHTTCSSHCVIKKIHWSLFRLKYVICYYVEWTALRRFMAVQLEYRVSSYSNVTHAMLMVIVSFGKHHLEWNYELTWFLSKKPRLQWFNRQSTSNWILSLWPNLKEPIRNETIFWNQIVYLYFPTNQRFNLCSTLYTGLMPWSWLIQRSKSSWEHKCFLIKRSTVRLLYILSMAHVTTLVTRFNGGYCSGH